MSTLSVRPMSLVVVEFEELYQRHLCRHSQLGINAAHLVALFGIWHSVYGILYWLFPTPWLLVGLGISYLSCLAASLPIRVFALTTLFVAGLCGTVFYAHLPWVWVYPILIPVCYKLQSWSHKLYDIEHDMTEFNAKYVPGKVLFFVLLFYEVPIVLNFLAFGYRDWHSNRS